MSEIERVLCAVVPPERAAAAVHPAAAPLGEAGLCVGMGSEAVTTVQKLSYVVPIIVREERLNNLSDLAIGEAMGGEFGRILADHARRNLAVLDEIERPFEDDGSTAPTDAPDVP